MHLACGLLTDALASEAESATETSTTVSNVPCMLFYLRYVANVFYSCLPIVCLYPMFIKFLDSFLCDSIYLFPLATTRRGGKRLWQSNYELPIHSFPLRVVPYAGNCQTFVGSSFRV
jgi:hypothetical protein